MSTPEIIQEPGRIVFHWKELLLHITVTRLRSHQDGRVTGELQIATDAPGYNPHLHQAQFNFSASRSRSDLAREMETKYAEADWKVILEQLCVHVLRIARAGAPLEEFDGEGAVLPRYLLYPLLHPHHPTVLFGEGGTGKSQLGLLLLAIAALPWENNPLGLIPPVQPTRGLYLDWEMDSETIQWRLHCLYRGAKLPPTPIAYRRCALPLADDMEAIQGHVTTSGAQLLIIDSLAGAVGGDLNSTEPALRFFTALRQLQGPGEPVSSLLIAHTSKEESKKKTPYGSAFFFNYSRSVWEVKKQQEQESRILELGLFHRKTNFATNQRPLGIKITFEEDSTQYSPCDVRHIPEFAQYFSLSTRILETLKTGASNRQELSEVLNESGEKIHVTLSRLKKRGLIVSLPDARWGLPAKGDIPEAFR